MMTACDLSAITKPWEIQSKVSHRLVGLACGSLMQGQTPGGQATHSHRVLTCEGFPGVLVESADTEPLAGPWDAL